MAHPEDPFRLSVVIPVWNDTEGLTRLLHQLLPLPGVDQIIVVDDASDTPCTAETLGLNAARDTERLVWLYSDERRGAGHARNLGLAEVTCPHVLFFDSDDLLLPGFQDLLHDLARPDTPDFDFCLFRHVDSRTRHTRNPAPLASDQRHWEAVNAPQTPSPLTPEQAARLCRISAYPWNKIYKTAFLHAKKIRCTEIMVHNDLELHWTGFLRASRILASSRLCSEHFVHADGRRLTNRSGQERFEVFQALENVQADISADGGLALRYANAAAAFYVDLFTWIDGMLDPPLRAPFLWKAQAFLRRAISLPIFALLATSEPQLARRLLRFLEKPAP